jgi:SAM-dependent methyltransferase
MDAVNVTSQSANDGHDITLAPPIGRGSRGERLERTSCLLCGGDDSQVLAESDATERKIVKCRHDGLIYLNPRPDAASLRRFFESEFITVLDQEMLKSFRRATLKRTAGFIKRLKPGGGNLLDVGCAMGTLFENFLTPEWCLFGVDTAHFDLEGAVASANVNLFVGSLHDAHYPDSFFDVVSLLDALYYFHDPLSELREMRRILKPDGVLAIEIDGLNYTLLRKQGPIAWALDGKWSLMPQPRVNHLYYFSPAAIKQLLARTGFRVAHMIPGQASLGRHGLVRLANYLQFAAARILFAATRGTVSIAARELYLSIKTPG